MNDNLDMTTKTHARSNKTIVDPKSSPRHPDQRIMSAMLSTLLVVGAVIVILLSGLVELGYTSFYGDA